ncbi:Nicotinamide_N-methyltransferase [Hexamita inflata]|uniref:Nicotinamide_N-methyltransferase n=1 Tax=Hexamita inflata TaxID=28002 RepID=A0ABP1GFW0_9EUKA
MQFCESSDSTPAPQFITYDSLNLRLAPEHSLWSHVLWNSSKFIYKLINESRITVQNKSVYELGCGCALPSIASVLNNAEHVIASEYPDQELLDNIQFNLSQNIPTEKMSKIEVHGHKWGEKMPERQFDIMFQADLVFNHSEHVNLVKEIKQCLKQDGQCHVVFSFHRPQYKQHDLQFFVACKQEGLKVEHKETIKMDRMFPEDDNIYEIGIREDVHWYIVTKQ